MPGATLSLRPLRPGDELALRRAHREMADEGFTFALGYGVHHEHRRRGYATEILRRSLDIAHAVASSACS